MKLIYIDKNIIGTVTKYCHLFLIKKGRQQIAPANAHIKINCPPLIEKSNN
jgi:hypothetical protein